MAGIGNVTHDEATHRAECGICPWTIETPVAGKAAKELMEHNAEEHR
jgi:ribosomal protein S27E